MNKHCKISASMMCANPFYMRETFDALMEENVEYLHLDIMDGKFVPNLGLGLDYIRELRKKTCIPFDFHCMVTNPDELIRILDVRPDDIISIHYESTAQIMRTIENAHKLGCNVLIAINPGTPLSMLEEIIHFVDGINLLMVNPGFAGQKMVPFALNKARKLQEYLESVNLSDKVIEVDGNITFEYAQELRKLGASVFVAGTSSIFGTQGIKPGSIKTLRASFGL